MRKLLFQRMSVGIAILHSRYQVDAECPSLQAKTRHGMNTTLDLASIYLRFITPSRPNKLRRPMPMPAFYSLSWLHYTFTKMIRMLGLSFYRLKAAQ